MKLNMEVSVVYVLFLHFSGQTFRDLPTFWHTDFTDTQHVKKTTVSKNILNKTRNIC